MSIRRHFTQLYNVVVNCVQTNLSVNGAFGGSVALPGDDHCHRTTNRIDSGRAYLSMSEVDAWTEQVKRSTGDVAASGWYGQCGN